MGWCPYALAQPSPQITTSVTFHGMDGSNRLGLGSPNTNVRHPRGARDFVTPVTRTVVLCVHSIPSFQRTVTSHSNSNQNAVASLCLQYL